MIPTSPQMRISSITYVKSEFQTTPLLWLISPYYYLTIIPSVLQQYFLHEIALYDRRRKGTLHHVLVV